MLYSAGAAGGTCATLWSAGGARGLGGLRASLQEDNLRGGGVAFLLEALVLVDPEQ